MRGVIALIVIGVAWLLLQPAEAAPPAPVYVVATVTPQPPTAVIQPAPNEAPARIVMPAIGLDAAIIPAPPEAVPQTAVGWWDSPERGDVVLYGHNYGVFAPLANVQTGQVVGLEYAGGTTWHTVTALETRTANGYMPDAVPGQIILITCLPFPAGSAERLIVYAR